jgi:YggT family protein
MTDALAFIIRTIFDIAAILFLARFLLQAARADFYNPLSQAIVAATEPVVRPVRSVVPGYRNIDFASFTAALLAKLIGFILISLLVRGGFALLPVLLHALYETLRWVLTMYFLAILISIVLSWIAPGSTHPGALLVRQVVEPLLAPARQLLPPLGGMIDLSPIIVIMALMLARDYLLPGVFAALARLLS